MICVIFGALWRSGYRASLESLFLRERRFESCRRRFLRSQSPHGTLKLWVGSLFGTAVVFWWPDPAKAAAVCGVLKRQVQHQPNLSPTMPPRPFPFPLRIGTDICYLPRIRNFFRIDSHSKNGGSFEGFLKRILTHPERVHFRHRFGTNQKMISSDITPVAKFLAGRFAISEAVVYSKLTTC